MAGLCACGLTLTYFRKFRPNVEYSILFADGNYTDPKNIADALISSRKYSDLDIDYGDKAFCVIDTDVSNIKQRDLDEAIHICKNKAEVILSNPCFEIWFLFHFIQNGSTKCYSSNDELMKELQFFIPKYTKTMDVFNSLEDKLNIAIDNAIRLEEYHKTNGKKARSIECNPSTEVYKIIQYFI